MVSSFLNFFFFSPFRPFKTVFIPSLYLPVLALSSSSASLLSLSVLLSVSISFLGSLLSAQFRVLIKTHFTFMAI